jgi:hypothetical protein
MLPDLATRHHGSSAKPGSLRSQDLVDVVAPEIESWRAGATHTAQG